MDLEKELELLSEEVDNSKQQEQARVSMPQEQAEPPQMKDQILQLMCKNKAELSPVELNELKDK